MSVVQLAELFPVISPEELVIGLEPPPRFGAVRFGTYRPDPAEPSQAAAVRALTEFADQISTPPRRGLFRKAAAVTGGYYLDGGFGVGKTHLLASLWHQVPAPKAYGTFVEYTHLVGALGFVETVRRLSGHRLLAVDEFELDDPGRHHADDAVARPAVRRRRPAGGDVQHVARQAGRGAIRRRGLPPRDPCAVSTFRDAAGRRAGLPACRAGAGPAADGRRRAAGGRGRRRPGAQPRRVRRRSPTTSPSCTRPATDGWSTGSAPRTCPGCVRWTTSRRRCAGWC